VAIAVPKAPVRWQRAVMVKVLVGDGVMVGVHPSRSKGFSSEFEGTLKKGKVEILARNETPQIKCDQCEKPATTICTECLYDGGGWLCDDCASTHGCDEDMFLPLVNSPRAGVCGYTG
jgi:Zn finger protein HypA/HybF involved in hydrogenase expression